MAGPSENRDQLWFILKESMSEPSFLQKDITLSQIRQRGLILNDCLRIVNVKGNPADFSFHIFSASMAAAVRLLSDESVLTTYRLYCQKDPVVVIFIRDANDPSPNTSKAPSHENSLRSRQSTARGRGKLVPELFIRPKPRHVSGSSDIGTLEEIKNEKDMVTVHLGGSDYVTFSKEYLVCKSKQ
jgi:hypothetical protein